MGPNFIVIGAARSGTTSLFQYLDPHPEVFVSQVKELNFFSNERYWKKGVKWYESQFSGANQQTQAVGEASTSYTKAPFTKDVVKRIHDYNPGMKLIYIVRDPIDRYISHYMKRVQTGIETRDFSQTLENLDSEACAWQGRYHYQLQKYLEQFPRNLILVRSMDDLKKNPRTVIFDISNFLGINPDFDIADLNRVHNATTKVVRKTSLGFKVLNLYRHYIEPRNIPFTFKKLITRVGDIGGIEVTKPVLTEAQFQKLSHFYKEDAKRLSADFDIDISHWKVCK